MNVSQSIEMRLIELRKVDEAALSREYKRLYGKAPPSGSNREWLLRAIGYRLQKQWIAQLRHRSLQTLIAAETIISALTTISSDTLLIRKWRGRCHIITILDDGVLYRDRRHPSLSAVARTITHGKMDGDAFFRRGDKRARGHKGK